jgi:multicomponent Na+:H+ antiporter subunit G
MTFVAAVAILIGAAFCLLAALGMLRFPDVFTRAHAASKAGVLGVGLILAGVAFASEDLSVAAAVIVGIIFVVVTGPVAAHLLARAALKSGTPPAPSTNIEK